MLTTQTQRTLTLTHILSNIVMHFTQLQLEPSIMICRCHFAGAHVAKKPLTACCCPTKLSLKKRNMQAVKAQYVEASGFDRDGCYSQTMRVSEYQLDQWVSSANLHCTWVQNLLSYQQAEEGELFAACVLCRFSVVNNSVYCNYLEDCRSEAFHALGFDVHEAARSGKKQ